MVGVEIDPALCKGCGLCVSVCPEHALEVSPTPNRRGVYVVRLMEGVACAGCRQCATMCPEAAIRIYQE